MTSPESSMMSEDLRPYVELPGSPPTSAGVYDTLRGGKDNFGGDRATAEQLTEIIPELPELARANRQFLIESVETLARMEMRWFLDLGSGLPSNSPAKDDLHRVAQRIVPDARFVYVDNNPNVAAHGRALLATNDLVRIVEADVRNTTTLLQHPDIEALRSGGKPGAVIAGALLHFMPDDEPRRILTTLREWMPEGSHLVLSHACPGAMSKEDLEKATAAYVAADAQIYPRPMEEIVGLFDGFKALEPGVVPLKPHRPRRTNAPVTQSGHFVGGIAVLRNR